MKKKYLLLVIITLSLIRTTLFAQGNLCSQATPFCTSVGTPFTYQNVIGSSVGQTGPNYGCLGSEPRPSWFYIKTSAIGVMTYSLTQSTTPGGAPDLDVDYIAYGPFATPASCGSLTAANTVGCSYSAAATETVAINSTAVGQIFIIMITNYNGGAGYITFTQTGGPPSDCSISCPLNNFTLVGTAFTGTVGAAFASGSTLTCNKILYLDAPNLPLNDPNHDILTPCIQVAYEPLTANMVTNATVKAFEGGFQAWATQCPTATCGAGNSIAGTSTVTGNNFSTYFVQVDPTQTHDFSFCKGAGAIGPTTITLKSCWDGVNLGSPTVWNGPAGASCFTLSLPANTSNVGSASFSIAPATGSVGLVDTHWGQAHIDPSLIPGGQTYTVTYTFQGPQLCAPVHGTFTFSVPAVPVLTGMASLTKTVCAGSTVSATNFTTSPAGGAYTWNNDNAAIGVAVSGNTNIASYIAPNVLSATIGVFTVTPTQAGCIGTSQHFSITIEPKPTLTVSTAPTSICLGSAFSYTFSGANTYSVVGLGAVPATGSYTPPASGTVIYTINATSAAGCTNTAVTSITISPAPTVAISSVSSPTICSGNNSTITPSGASTYTLLNSGATGTSFNVSPSTTTTYSIVGTSASSCPSTNTITTTITVNTTPTITIGSITSNTICSGQSVTITPSGASASYTLNPGGSTTTPFVVTPGSTTGYTISGTNTGGCVSTAATNLTTTITVNATPTIAISSITSNTICSGQSVTITPSGASSGNYTLTPGGSTTSPFVVTPGSTTSYTINGSNSNGCISTTATDLNTTITVNGTPTITIGSITSNTICSGQSVTITPSGASASYTLNPGGLTATPFVVTPGSTAGYTISGTNTGGCVSTAATNLTTTITVNATPTIAIGSITSNTICSGQSVTITPSGASASYTLNPGGLTATPFVVSPGSTTGYTISGTNTGGCVSTAATNLTTTITVNATPTIVIGSITSNTICSGQSVTITPSGASSGNYTLTPGGSTTSPFVVTPGSTTSYTINGSNSNGCVSTTATDLNTTITVNTTPTITIGSITSNTICSGQSVTITPSGASASYTLNPGGLTVTPFVVSPGSTTGYTISGTNAGGCVSTAATNLTTTITVNATPTIAIGSITSNTICSGQSVTITPSGASSGNYTLTPGGSTTSPFVVTPGSTTSYTINGSNSNGCISTTATDLNTTITVYATPISTASTTGSITCVTNTINLNSTLSGAGITYTWTAPGGSSISGSPNIQNAIGQGLGTYTLNLKGAGGCTYSTTIAAIQNITTPTSVDAGPNKTLVCVSPTVSLLGSATPATAIANWLGGVSNPATFTTSTGAAGVYTLQAINPATGCFISDTVRVFQSVISPTVTSNAVTNSITCVNSTVPIGISVTCPDPYTIAWPTGTGISGPTNTLTTTATLTGVYQVTVTNTFNSCISINSINVPIDQTPVAATISPASTITCNTPSLTLSASPVGSTYTYTWTGVAPIVSGGSTQNPVINTGGTYSVAITNTVNGCIGNASITVASNTVAPVVSIASPTVQTTCANPTITIAATSTPSTGVTYSWSAPPTGSLDTYIVSNPIASGSGIFTVVVTNTTSGCSSSLTQNTVEVIADAAIPIITLSANSLTITCTNTTVTASISTTSTPVSYSWSPTAGIVPGTETTANPIFNAADSYSVVVTNATSGCATSISGNVVTVSLDNTIPVISLSSTSNSGTITCTNTFVTISPTVTPNSNLTYTWSPSTVSSTTLTSATFTAGGVYTLAITNTLTGCVTSLTNTANTYTIVADNTPPTFTLGTAPSVTATCAIPSVTLSASSDAGSNGVYTWLTPVPSTVSGNPVVVSTAGIYTVAVTNTVNGCSSASAGQNTVEVVADAGIPNVSLSSNTLAITCAVPNPSVSASTTATPVSYNWTPTVGIVPGTETTATPSFTAPNSYSLVVQNTSSGCATGISSNVVTVTLDNAIPSVSLTTGINNGIITCTYTFVTISPTVTPTSNLTYTWSPSGVLSNSINDATFTTGGIYTLAVTNTLTGCVSTSTSSANTFTVVMDTASVSISINTISTNTIIGCGAGNSSVTFSTTTSANTPVITWLPGPVNTPTLDVTSAGIYTLNVSDAASGCFATTQFTVTGNTTPPQGVDAGTTANIACGSSTLVLNGVTTATNVNYSWSGPSATSIASGSNTANPIVTEVGPYILTVSDNLTGCQSTATVNVSQAIATASITADPITGISPLTVNFNGSGLGTLAYNWNFGDSNTSNVQNPSNTFNTGTFTVTLTTSSGSCVATATLLIIVEDGLTLEIPNVFTPNNDGSNDIFTIKSTGVKEISLQIFNRWGEKLYEFSGPKASWDGLAPNGSKVPEGTYFYFVKATGFDGKEIEKHGTMNLFR